MALVIAPNYRIAKNIAQAQGLRSYGADWEWVYALEVLAGVDRSTHVYWCWPCIYGDPPPDMHDAMEYVKALFPNITHVDDIDGKELQA